MNPDGRTQAFYLSIPAGSVFVVGLKRMWRTMQNVGVYAKMSVFRAKVFGAISI
jgi:hypothetical protein